VTLLQDIDRLAAEAAQDSRAIDEFIIRNEFFILKTASKISKRYIRKSDDEWSVSMTAFYEALRNYNREKGSFFSFAELIMRRRLIDHFRLQGRFRAEVQVEEVESDAIIDKNDNNLRMEIEDMSKVLGDYDFKFMDLVECSPKARKTKTACAKVISYLLRNPILFEELRSSKKLQVKVIEKNLKLPRKIIERHRKYIIAATEILRGDYPYLSEYLKYVWEEENL
jgi:RNA polymerase sigma factor